MELAVGESYVRATQPFVDGFGERRAIDDARGQRFDVLQIKPTLGAVPSFESSVRERAGRISSFRHESFSRIRTVEIDKSTGSLLVVSDHVRGVRLSTLLAAAEKRSVPVDLPAAACLIRQLVRAVAAWREQMPDIVHGAIGPDRIMITPDARLILVESVFGSALEHLHYSRQRYWEELGVPLPATLTVDARADVLQVGAVALALVLGRRLTANDRLDQIQPAFADRVTPATRVWISRALQLEPAGLFTSVLDARAALDQAFGEPDIVEEQDSLLLFMARCLALNVEAPVASNEETSETSDAIPGSDDLPDVDLGTRIEALRTFLARRSSRSSGAESDKADQATSPGDWIEELPPDPDVLPVEAPVAAEHQERTRLAGVIARLPNDWTRRLLLAAAATLAIVVALAVIVFGVLPWSRGPSMGTFSIETRPVGIAVTIDGMPRGVTPLTLDLSAGDHLVELVTETEHRKIPVTIRAESESSQFLEMGAVASATTSELRIRTEPLGAAVTVDGQYVGQSPVSVGDLTPGPHTVALKHEAGSATEQVLIEAGKTASLFVPLAAQPAAAGAAAGWISVAAPVDLQLFENGRFLGSSQIDRIMLPTGRHELNIVNDALGFQERRVVQVTAGQVTSIRPNWPTGSLSINAVPWALVFVDGTPLGETPIANARVPIGQHEILFRHPQLGEHRASVTVTAREPARVGIDLRSK